MTKQDTPFQKSKKICAFRGLGYLVGWFVVLGLTALWHLLSLKLVGCWLVG